VDSVILPATIHESEEAEFRGPLLWDADPDVCCAAFQLGACQHTEAYHYEDVGCSLCGTLGHTRDECPDEDTLIRELYGSR
jgi:hypothetical protein